MDWETSGFVDVESGALGTSTFTMGETLVPRLVEIVDTPNRATSLIWRMWVESPHEGIVRGSSARMLDNFVRIRDADGVRDFARRFGVLGLCQHDRPATHNPAPRWPRTTADLVLGGATWATMAGGAPMMDAVPEGSFCQPRTLRNGFHIESVAVWLDLAAQMRAVLNVVKASEDGQDGRQEDLDVLGFPKLSADAVAANNAARKQLEALAVPLPKSPLADHTPLQMAPEVARFRVAWKVQEWASWAYLSPSLVWRAGKPLTFAVEVSTFGSLVMQLMIAISGRHGLETCGGCGALYMRERKAQAGRRNYCPDCRSRKVPQRDAARDARARRNVTRATNGETPGRL